MNNNKHSNVNLISLMTLIFVAFVATGCWEKKSEAPAQEVGSAVESGMENATEAVEDSAEAVSDTANQMDEAMEDAAEKVTE